MEKLEHIGIAVKNLDQANALFEKLLGRPHYKVESVESEGVKTSFFEIGGVKIELLEASRADSPLPNLLRRRARESII
jgi:methylmalonyl-CoA/ethylmalonyl-CoA epimerase